MANDDLGVDYDRLRELVLASVKPRGSFSERALSLQATDGENADLVRNFLKKGTKPLIKSVIGLTTAMDVSLAEVMKDWIGPVPKRGHWLLVAGTVEAGVWREQIEWGPEDWYEIEVQIADTNRRDFGLLVSGRSMEKSLPPGTVLRCVNLIYSGADWQDGDYVIVERQQGGLRELTCKKLFRRPDGAWELHAESYQPEFQEPIYIGRPVDADDGPPFDALTDDEIRVVALVVDAYLPLLRRRKRAAADRGTEPALFH